MDGRTDFIAVCVNHKLLFLLRHGAGGALAGFESQTPKLKIMHTNRLARGRSYWPSSRTSYLIRGIFQMAVYGHTNTCSMSQNVFTPETCSNCCDCSFGFNQPINCLFFFLHANVYFWVTMNLRSRFEMLKPRCCSSPVTPETWCVTILIFIPCPLLKVGLNTIFGLLIKVSPGNCVVLRLPLCKIIAVAVHKSLFSFLYSFCFFLALFLLFKSAHNSSSCCCWFTDACYNQRKNVCLVVKTGCALSVCSLQSSTQTSHKVKT